MVTGEKIHLGEEEEHPDRTVGKGRGQIRAREGRREAWLLYDILGEAGSATCWGVSQTFVERRYILKKVCKNKKAN